MPNDPIIPVSLAAVTWHFPLVGRTRMLNEAWAAAGRNPVFVQIPSYRTALERLRNAPMHDGAVAIVRPWPTWPARGWLRIGERRLRRAIRSRAAELRRQLDRIVEWERAAALVVSPVWTPWLSELPFGRVVYDCIDDVAVQTPRVELASLYRGWEAELIERADAAVVSAEVLGEGIRGRRGDMPMATIRNGVDVERFERAAAALPRPADLPAGERPIVGFVGALYEWIDWRLIGEVARAMPRADFVFVGPHDGRPDAAALADRPNVTFLGARPYGQVPAYMAAFDVCWVPFDTGAISRAANPVKIYEYLALGKPVVSTPVADTEAFEGLVEVGRDADQVISLLNAALTQATDLARERVEFARRNSWAERGHAYMDFLGRLATSDDVRPARIERRPAPPTQKPTGVGI